MFASFTEENQKVLRGIIYSKYSSAAEFARALGWNKQKLSLIMTGQREPSVSDVNSIAKGLNHSVDSITKIFCPEGHISVTVEILNQ